MVRPISASRTLGNQIVGFLQSHGPLPKGEIARLTGKDKSQVDLALSLLGNKVRQFGGNWNGRLTTLYGLSDLNIQALQHIDEILPKSSFVPMKGGNIQLLIPNETFRLIKESIPKRGIWDFPFELLRESSKARAPKDDFGEAMFYFQKGIATLSGWIQSVIEKEELSKLSEKERDEYFAFNGAPYLSKSLEHDYDSPDGLEENRKHAMDRFDRIEKMARERRENFLVILSLESIQKAFLKNDIRRAILSLAPHELESIWDFVNAVTSPRMDYQLRIQLALEKLGIMPTEGPMFNDFELFAERQIAQEILGRQREWPASLRRKINKAARDFETYSGSPSIADDSAVSHAG